MSRADGGRQPGQGPGRGRHRDHGRGSGRRGRGLPAVFGEGVARGPVAIFWEPRQSPTRGPARAEGGGPGAVVGASGAGEGGQRQPPASGARGQGGDGGGDPVLPKDWRFWIVDMRY